MLDKRHSEKIKLVPELENTSTEICVAHGRSVEPYIKVFSHNDENIAKSQLGTLFGVFEITEQSEDSAYIVNFLASVAKKEYFNNPRRGAVESFEAALHKINLALAELVKHGNVAWLGKLHGALGVLEKSNFHFSVTGEAKILLLRNGSLSELSIGLASEESALHPIKTFVEVASGRLLPEDKIILTSPEIFALLPPDDVEKNALRMDNERFAQFLRTVLVNELSMAGTIVIDIQEKPITLPKPQKEEGSSTVTKNVFSEIAFASKTKREPVPSPENTAPSPASEYVDSKTGHIYVQGHTPTTTPTHPAMEHVKLALQETAHRLGSFLVAHKKLLRKGRRQAQVTANILTTHSATLFHKAARAVRKEWRRRASSIRYKTIPPSPQKSAAPLHPPVPQVTQPEYQETHPSVHGDSRDAIPDFMKEKLATFYRKNHIPEPQVTPIPFTVRLQSIPRVFRRFMQRILWKMPDQLQLFGRLLARSVRTVCSHPISWFRSLLATRRRIVVAGSSIIILLGVGISFWLWKSGDQPIPVTETPPTETPAFQLDTEKNATLLPDPLTLATQDDRIIATVLLDNDTYIITDTSVVNVRENTTYSLPVGNGSAILAAPMDDLRLIFIYTDAAMLFAWSPINHAFVKNTLSMPEGTTIKDIDTYLTYLYVLDGTHNQVYRFPRAEGGFGISTLWMRDPVTLETAAQLAVHETIYIAPNQNTIQAFFRGRFVRNLESPNTPLMLTHLFTRPGFANVYALDAANKRILVWNQDGALIAQYFSEQLSEAQTINVNETTGEVFITTPHSLLSAKINTGQ